MPWGRLLIFMLALVPAGAHSDDLLSIYQAALENDPRIKIADLDIAIGQADQRQAVGKLLPQASGRASLSDNRQDLEQESARNAPGIRDSFPGERYSVSLSQTLFDVPKYHHWQASKALTIQRQAERKNVQQQLTLKVVEAYFAVLRYHDDLTSVDHEIAAAESLVMQAERRYQRKLLKIVDLLEAKARRDMLQANKVESHRQLTVAREGLSELTGQQPGELQALGDHVAFIDDEEPFEIWLEKAQSRSSALAGLRQAISVQEQTLKEEKAAHLPVVELQLTHQKSDLGFENSPRPVTTTDIASIEVSMPLYAGGITSARVAVARYQLQKTRLAYEAELSQLTRRVRDARLGATSSVRRIAAFGSARQSAITSAQAMHKGFSLGVVTVTDVLDAESDKYSATRDVNQARYDYVVNWARLLTESGVAERAEIERINSWLVAEKG